MTKKHATPANTERKNTKHSTLTNHATIAKLCSSGRHRPDEGCNGLAIKNFNDRWIENNRPWVFQQALAKLLASIAQYQTHCPVFLSHEVGFPLGFVSRCVAALLQSRRWLGPDGYASLVDLLDSSRDDEYAFDAAVGDLMCSALDQVTFARLEAEWFRALGVRFSL